MLGGALLFGLMLLAVDRYGVLLRAVPLVGGVWGMVAYTALCVVATVVAPFTSAPLMPVASSLYGSLTTALLSIAGWTVGAVLAFLIARKYGPAFLMRFKSRANAEVLAQRLLGPRPFWSLVFMRMLLPVDILSYVVGALVPMSLLRYTLATALGVAPFAFVFAYAAQAPLWLKGALVCFAGAALLVMYIGRGKNAGATVTETGKKTVSE